MTKQAEMFKNFWFWFLITIFFTNIVGGFAFKLYEVWYFDIIMHFLGGFGVYFLAKKYFEQILKEASFFDSTLLLIGMTVFVGVVWEFYEFALSNIWRIRPDEVELIGDLRDTIYDLAIDTFGAITGSVLHFFRHGKPQKIQSVF